MPDHPCVTDPLIPECVEVAEKLAAQVPGNSVTEVLKANAPAVIERLDAAIAHIGTWVETGEAFAGEQVPLLVQEIVYWGIASQAYWVVLGACFLLLCGSLTRLCFKRWSAWSELRQGPQEMRKGWTIGIAIVSFILGFFMFTLNIMDMLKPLVAPRLYLIEYFRHLVQ